MEQCPWRLFASRAGVSLPCAEQPVACVSETWKDVSLRIEFTIERGTVDRHIGMACRQPPDALGCRDDAEKADARCPGPLERCHGRSGASPRGQHRIQDEKLPLAHIARNLEVVVHWLERVVITVQTDVPDPSSR